MVVKNGIVALIGAIMCATPAVAVEVAGGSIGLTYSAFTDETDQSRLSVEGSVELAFTQEFSGQFDVGRDTFGLADLSSNTIGLHGIYNVSEATAVGFYYTLESVESGGAKTDADVYGFEIDHTVGRTDFESYIGRGDTGTEAGTLLGIAGRYEMNNGVGIGGRFDYADVRGLEAGMLAVRLDNDVTDSLNLYVEVGSAKARAFGISDSEPYVGLGGKIVFGDARASRFERRGLARILPGL